MTLQVSNLENDIETQSGVRMGSRGFGDLELILEHNGGGLRGGEVLEGCSVDLGL